MRGTNPEPRPKQKSPATRQHGRLARSRRYLRLEVEALEARVMPTVVSIGPSKDNTLYQSAAGTTSNGAGQFLFAGKTNQPSDAIRRGVIAFDVAGSVPAGATINGVTLHLHMSRPI